MFSHFIKIFLLINLILVPAFLAEKANNFDFSALDSKNGENVAVREIKRIRRGKFLKAVAAGALIGGGAALASKFFKG
ncbi:hypothetical protein ACQ4LE_009914 [Meloidogyne hapla]